jgi:hypothetical protein
VEVQRAEQVLPLLKCPERLLPARLPGTR